MMQILISQGLGMIEHDWRMCSLQAVDAERTYPDSSYSRETESQTMQLSDQSPAFWRTIERKLLILMHLRRICWLPSRDAEPFRVHQCDVKIQREFVAWLDETMFVSHTDRVHSSRDKCLGKENVGE
jgi:hypothetical protein